jgi:hypothetical protein
MSGCTGGALWWGALALPTLFAHRNIALQSSASGLRSPEPEYLLCVLLTLSDCARPPLRLPCAPARPSDAPASLPCLVRAADGRGHQPGMHQLHQPDDGVREVHLRARDGRGELRGHRRYVQSHGRACHSSPQKCFSAPVHHCAHAAALRDAAAAIQRLATRSNFSSTLALWRDASSAFRLEATPI